MIWLFSILRLFVGGSSRKKVFGIFYKRTESISGVPFYGYTCFISTYLARIFGVRFHQTQLLRLEKQLFLPSTLDSSCCRSRLSGPGGAGSRQVLRPGLRAVHVARDAGGAGHDAGGDGPGGAPAAAAGATRSAAVLPAATGHGAAVGSADDRHQLPAIAGAAVGGPAVRLSAAGRLPSATQQRQHPAAATAAAAVLAGREVVGGANIVHVTRKRFSPTSSVSFSTTASAK